MPQAWGAIVEKFIRGEAVTKLDFLVKLRIFLVMGVGLGVTSTKLETFTWKK